MIDHENILQVQQGGDTWSFRFDTIYLRGVVKFCVTAFENNHKASIFFMERKGERWKIINAPQVTGKFLGMDALLNDFINQNMLIQAMSS